MLIKPSLYTTAPKILYLIINLLKTLNHPRIILTPKTQNLTTGRRNNHNFLVICRSRYLIYLPKHLIRSVLIKGQYIKGYGLGLKKYVGKSTKASLNSFIKVSYIDTKISNNIIP